MPCEELAVFRELEEFGVRSWGDLAILGNAIVPTEQS